MYDKLLRRIGFYASAATCCGAAVCVRPSGVYPAKSNFQTRGAHGLKCVFRYTNSEERESDTRYTSRRRAGQRSTIIVFGIRDTRAVSSDTMPLGMPLTQVYLY